MSIQQYGGLRHPGSATVRFHMSLVSVAATILIAGSGQIAGFFVDPVNGALAKVNTQVGLPANAGAQGIAARDFCERVRLVTIRLKLPGTAHKWFAAPPLLSITQEQGHSSIST